MSMLAEPRDRPLVTEQNLLPDVDLVPADGHYAPHHHRTDQLAWPRGGGVRVRIDEVHWRVSADQLLWIPAFAEHEMWIEGASSLLSLYLDPVLRPDGERWRGPLVLPAAEPLGANLAHLCSGPRTLRRRTLGFELIRDLLEDSPAMDDVLVLPDRSEARAVAEALLTDPSLDWTIEDFARVHGTSSKTILRAFLAHTGLSFEQWRMRARMHHARRLLGEGLSVSEAAEDVGYATATGFIKAYRRVFGTTPGRHVARGRA